MIEYDSAPAKEFRERLRAQMRATMIARNLPTDPADEISDLACQAADEALAAIFRVTGAASCEEVCLTALSLGADLARQRIVHMQATFDEAAKDSGFPIATISVPGAR